MSTAIGSSYLTLLDYAKRTDPGGGIGEVIDVLAASNPILSDANVMEGNLPTGHRSIQRATQPSGTWRKLNYGVASEKSTTVQRDDVCGMLEAYSEVDTAIANLGGNAAAFRASEDDAFVSGLGSTAATAIFYGNQGVNPEQINGLSPRYNSTTGDYSSQIISASGSSSDNTSVWLITWGPKTCSLIYPKGSSAGLKAQDLGETTSVDSNGLMHQVYRTHFIWNLGLALMDYRYCIRICNIDVSDLSDDAASGADIIRQMVAAWFARPTMSYGNMAKTFWYCNSTVAEYLAVQAQNKSNVNLTVANPGGEPIVVFYGAPIRVCDNITSAEAAVS
jgi:hypothetical protein